MSGELARAEDIVRSHLGPLCEQLLALFSVEATDHGGPCSWKADILTSEHSAHPQPPGTRQPQDDVMGGKDEVMGGDMNLIQRVCIIVKCCHGDQREKGEYQRVFSVIVKMAPQNVLFLQEISGEQTPVDPRKVRVEFAALCKCNDISPGSVPRPLLLDQTRNALILEDLSAYSKLSEQLSRAVEPSHVLVLKSTLQFIGLVHSTTWTGPLEQQERDGEFHNPAMKALMADLLFQRPYDPQEKSNRCNPLLLQDIASLRNDRMIKKRVEELREAFLQQQDCLCHGDLSCDNVMVSGADFKVLDFEFSSIGLRAYDIALFIETVIYHLFCHWFQGNSVAMGLLIDAVEQGTAAYAGSCGSERVNKDITFVQQVCGLIGCEQIWRVLGSEEVDDFDGNPEPECTLLEIGRDFLLLSDHSDGIFNNIRKHLSRHGVL